MEISEQERQRVIANIGKVLSEILSDKYGCKITLHFGPKEEVEADVSGMPNASVSSEMPACERA